MTSPTIYATRAQSKRLFDTPTCLDGFFTVGVGVNHMARVHSPPNKEDFHDPADVDPTALPERPSHDIALFIQPTVLQYTGSSTKEVSTGTIDEKKAYKQWYGLVESYEKFTDYVHVLNPLEEWRELQDEMHWLKPPWELPDIIFAANQSLPYPDEKRVMLSKMGRGDRRDEPAYLRSWYQKHGYETEVMEELDHGETFEGMGDAIWHPNRRLLWGGVGQRTSKAAYDELARRLDTHVISFDVQHDEVDAPIFHTDICFSVLDESSVMLIPDLFTDEDLKLFDHIWDTIIECPLSEGHPNKGYACNAHCVDGQNVFIQEGNDVTKWRLNEAGFNVHPVSTGELIKSNKGSVFCLKMMLP